MAAASDPYKVLGISAEASEDQLRDAYRRLVRIHHPDHNQGSAESARRFEQIQEAYARIRSLRAHARPLSPHLRPQTRASRTASLTSNSRSVEPTRPESGRDAPRHRPRRTRPGVLPTRSWGT